jgi:sucrose phosphorylase
VQPGEPPRPGLLTPDQIDTLVETIHQRTAGASQRATGAAASNLDLYQVNSSFPAALGDDRQYLAARVIQFFAPGIPQVYYVGALAGGNDLELLGRSGVGRDINRHHYTVAEIDEALHRPVVRALLELCRLRNSVPAFDGPLHAGLDGTVLTLTRTGVEVPTATATATIDLATGNTQLEWTHDGRTTRMGDVLELAR